MLNKKGQIFDNISGLAVGVVTLAIMLVIALLVVGQGRQQATSMTDSILVVNETVVFANNTYVAFATQKFASMDYGFSCNSVINTTSEVGGFVVVGSENYTCNWRGINLTCRDTETAFHIKAGASYNVTYTYKPASNAYNSSVTMQNATNTIPGWMPLIIIAFIGAILLGLVAMFRNR